MLAPIRTAIVSYAYKWKSDWRGEENMRVGRNAYFVILFVGLACTFGSAARAQVRSTPGVNTYSLKSGESVDLFDIFYVIACRSLLKSTPEVEIVEGPPQVSASVKEGMVLPRGGNCSQKVPGGTLVLTAKEIEDPSFSRLTVRILYKTRDGDRRLSHVFNLQLVP